MIIINDNDYSNPYGESNDNKTENAKNAITKIIKVLLACVAIKTLMLCVVQQTRTCFKL